MSEWISVDDRLPDDGQLVLVAKNNAINIKEFNSSSELGSFWWDIVVGECSLLYDYSHWMPLPEPPKEGDNK